MKRSQLIFIIKEVVEQTFNEMHREHWVDNENLVGIDGIKLPDGRVINASIGLEGHWENNIQFVLDRAYPEAVYTDDRAQTQLQLTPDLIKIIMMEFAEIEDEVVAEINRTPPDREGEKQDASYERWKDKSLGLSQ